MLVTLSTLMLLYWVAQNYVLAKLGQVQQRDHGSMEDYHLANSPDSWLLCKVTWSYT